MTRFFFWLLAGLVLTTPCAWGAEPAGAGPETGPPTVSDVIVRLDNVGPEDDKTLLEAMARSAIFIDPGDALAEKSLQDTIDALKLIAVKLFNCPSCYSMAVQALPWGWRRIFPRTT